MRGHIRKRGERAWAVVVDIGFDPRTGKRRQKWVSVTGTKRDAERRLAEVIHELNTGVFVEPSRITLADYLEQWLRDYAATAVRLRTAQEYRTIVRCLQDGLGRSTRLADLKPPQVQRYYAGLLDRGFSAQTVIHRHRLLSQALRQAVRWEMLTSNVMERVTPPRRTRPELRFLDAAGAQRLLSAAENTEYHLAIHLALYTGLRRSEILGLRWSDVDLDARSLTVVRTMTQTAGNPIHLDEPKSKSSRRTLSYSEATEQLLRFHRERHQAGPHEQVCQWSDGRTLRPTTLARGYERIVARAGISGIRFHDLRHTHASLLLAAGVPVNVVQARMGHASISTTVDVYGHVLPKADTEAGDTFERTLRLQNVCKTGKTADV